MKISQLDQYETEKIRTILSKISLIYKLDQQLHQIESHLEGFLNYEKILDLVYLQFTGKTRNEIASLFSSPSEKSESENKIVAWISPDSGNSYSGFIPEIIDSLILNSSFEFEQKMKRIYELFILLEDLYKNKESKPIANKLIFGFTPVLLSR